MTKQDQAVDQASSTPSDKPHVAIIMDGNGRWATAQGESRSFGHEAGIKGVKAIVRHAAELGLPALTFWGFSTDNWKRPRPEVDFLMALFQKFIKSEADELDAMNVQVRFIGRRSQLPEALQKLMGELEAQTADNDGLLLQVALNYGGVQEVVDAVQKLEAAGEAVTDESLLQAIYGEVPPPDLIIRTSGELRTSGFQPMAVHAELYFTDIHWPDFKPADLDAAVANFATRDRRKGGLSAKTK